MTSICMVRALVVIIESLCNKNVKDYYGALLSLIKLRADRRMPRVTDNNESF